MNDIAKIHVGNCIKNKMRDLKITQEMLAEKMGYQQPNIQRILKKSSMETDMLFAFSLALGYNFFKDFCVFEKSSENKNESATAPDWLLERYEKVVEKNGKFKMELEEKGKRIQELEEKLSRYENIKKVGAL